MWMVVVAGLFPIAAHIWYFGWGLAILILLGNATALIVESLMLKLRNLPVKIFALDGSAAITATGLALAMPPNSPWWLIVVGVSFALIFGKHLYGGLGYNPFNPAMLAYVFLLISFPQHMSIWQTPLINLHQAWSFSDAFALIFWGELPAGISADVLTGATPLSYVRENLGQGQYLDNIMTAGLMESTGSTSWMVVNAAFIVSGLFLLISRTIRWHIPITFLASMAVIAWIFHSINPDVYAPVEFHILGGGVLFAAFFLMTDPVTVPTTPLGRVIFAFGAAFLTYAIRNWGLYPDGVAFSILLMNMLTPLIEHWTRPRVYGE